MIEGIGGHNSSPDEFAEQRAEAVQAHSVGDIAAADALRGEILRNMDPSDPRYGGVLTTKAASSDRAGVPVGVTLPLAEEAAGILRNQLDFGTLEARSIARREHPIAVMYSGALAVKQGVQLLLSGDAGGSAQVKVGRDRLEESWTDILKVNGWRHQHPLNAMRRVSIAHSMAGDSFKGLGMALLAGVSAPLSESPWLLNGTSGLSRPDKMHAKGKASLGAGAAGAIAVLSAMPGSKPKTMARRLANKAI